ncbi:MAG TPA: RnfH family protein [Rhodocyclaceae bacterium]|nr:RnfH family protein [Rhodocyclaceae bacterium]
MADSIQVEVAYAKAERQDVVRLKLPAGTTIQQAIEASGLLQRYPEIEPGKIKVGVFGKLGRMDTVLRERDRVEIYRPLIADPKEVRKQRAAEGKSMKKGAGLADE